MHVSKYGIIETLEASFISTDVENMCANMRIMNVLAYLQSFQQLRWSCHISNVPRLTEPKVKIITKVRKLIN